VVSGVALPPLLVLTDGTLTCGRPLLDVVALAVDGGARAVLVREKHLDPGRRATLAARVRALLDPHGGLLLVASDHHIDADGVHLAARDPYPAVAAGIVGRSCHNAGDVARAAAEGCDYATLSPIFPTPSKPGYGPALGVAALADLPLPVWALGGVTHINAQACVDAGAAGVAVMGAVMGADDPAAATRRLANVVGAGRP
jgi:thiamine-phosphate diphosphorylase